MSDLKSIEKARLEKFLQMEGGYVCDFGFTTYRDFFIEAIGIDIFDEKYSEGNSGSKANRMRAFWTLESNTIVSTLLNQILDYWKSQLEIGVEGYRSFNPTLYDQCKQIVAKLAVDNSSITDIAPLIPNSSDSDFGILAGSIKKYIENDELQLAVDRLHTFVIKYLRVLCKKHGTDFDKNTSLISLTGGYVKFLRENDFIESEMSMEILKSTIKVLGAFDGVRNNQSLAHDNPILNKTECNLIFVHVSNVLRYIKSIEDKVDEANKLKTLSRSINYEDEPTDEEIDAAGDAWIESQIDIMRGK